MIFGKQFQVAALDNNLYALPMRVCTSVDCHAEPDRIPAISIPFAKSYVLKATVYVRFTANDAMFKSAKRNAEMLLCNTLFTGPINKLLAVQNSINMGDTVSALGMLEELVEELRGAKVL